MNKIKFIHCADLHLDTPFSGLSPDKASVRRDELRLNFSKIIDYCISKEVDFLFIAGDLFDKPHISDETVLFLKESFNKIKNVKVFISPGNHDPYMPGAKYEIFTWPENVHIFKEKEITKISLDTLNTNIYGAAFTAPYTDRNLLENFSCSNSSNGSSRSASNEGHFNIMIMHGETISGNQSNSYNPISLISILNSGLDYLALGHKHEFLPPQKEGATYYSYCGSPEGRGFDELDEKGIIYGELYKDTLGETRLNYEFIPCSSRIYREITVDVTGCVTHEEIINKISAALVSTSDLYKIFLTGSLKCGFLLDLRIIISRFSEKYFFIKYYNHTTTEIDFEELSKETMLKGIFTKRMLRKIEDARQKGDKQEETLYTHSLLTGLKAFESEVFVYDNQVN